MLYNADGTVKAAGKKIVWKESKTYKATKAKLEDVCRHQADTSRCLHGEVINQVFGRAGTVIVEKNWSKAFQRAGYGKSLGKSGAAGLITRMTSKAESAGCCVVEVSPGNCARVSTMPKREPTGRKLFGREVISWEIRAGTWTAMSWPP
ncbi:MAG: hypothetical protein V8R49_03300 [Duodenibacillus massiliensis]